MRISQFSDYAIQTLLHLATAPDRQMSISEIAAARDLSVNHLMKVVSGLSAAGFIAARRGRNGGLRLARPAQEINIGDVLRHTEGDEPLFDCTDCHCSHECRAVDYLEAAKNAFYAVLAQSSLADLSRRPASAPPNEILTSML